ncbi:hypothetical protein V2A60_001674 [Cordyceps javanica]
MEDIKLAPLKEELIIAEDQRVELKQKLSVIQKTMKEKKAELDRLKSIHDNSTNTIKYCNSLKVEVAIAELLQQEGSIKETVKKLDDKSCLEQAQAAVLRPDEASRALPGKAMELMMHHAIFLSNRVDWRSRASGLFARASCGKEADTKTDNVADAADPSLPARHGVAGSAMRGRREVVQTRESISAHDS